MKRNYNLRTIKTKKSYSTKELAELLGVHPQTVRSWQKCGLLSIEQTSHYPLFLGLTVKNFLLQQAKNQRTVLGPNELYCVSCGTSTTAQNKKIIFQNKIIGNDKQSIRYSGNCDKCGKTVNRFGSLPSHESVTE